ncbi:heme lyase CcmF/NrfE family subunit [soil metagenome]
MTGLLGTFALGGGLAASLVAVSAWGRAARHHDPRATRAGRRMLWVGCAAAVLACAVMIWALVTDDFSVRYVADNGARAVPLFYKVVSLWAALEGSLLLWLAVLTGFTVAAASRVPRRAASLHPPAMVTLSVICAAFFALAVFAGNAFTPVSPVPVDGPGPNPLLQDHPLMAIHPPLLYLGYVGLTVPFAYAVAALITGDTGRAWVAVTRSWTLAAWTFLTVGIVLGGWWSYEVLGWGGYWAWDPVENASILPWFTATALLHSIMVQRRRAALRVWNLALASATFLLVLVGTFLTRSGVVASVHAFTQSAIGPVLLGYIIVTFLVVAGLFVWRADRLGPDAPLVSGVSREAVFLGNNVVLVGLAFTVLLGTVFPLLVEAVTGDRVSVGAPYFNRMAVPLALAMVLLMGIGPLVPWGRADVRALGARLTVPAVVALLTIGGLGLAGLDGVTALLTFGLAAGTVTAIVGEGVGDAVATRHRDRVGPVVAVARALARRRRRYGGLLVHVGVVLAAVAIAASSTYTTQVEQRLAINESVELDGYEARLVDVERRRTPRRMEVVARVALSRGGTEFGVHEPMLAFYPAATQAVGTPSVQTGPIRDVYLTVAEVDPDSRWATVRMASTPLVLWLWVAGGVMAAGALAAGWPAGRRRRASASTDSDDVEHERGAAPVHS